MKRENKSRAGFWLQVPAIILFIIITVIGAFAIKIMKVPINGKEVSWFVPIIILLIAVAYFYGRSLEKKDNFSI